MRQIKQTIFLCTFIFSVSAFSQSSDTTLTKQETAISTKALACYHQNILLKNNFFGATFIPSLLKSRCPRYFSSSRDQCLEEVNTNYVRYFSKGPSTATIYLGYYTQVQIEQLYNGGPVLNHDCKYQTSSKEDLYVNTLKTSNVAMGGLTWDKCGNSRGYGAPLASAAELPFISYTKTKACDTNSYGQYVNCKYSISDLKIENVTQRVDEVPYLNTRTAQKSMYSVNTKELASCLAKAIR